MGIPYLCIDMLIYMFLTWDSDLTFPRRNLYIFLREEGSRSSPSVLAERPMPPKRSTKTYTTRTVGHSASTVFLAKRLARLLLSCLLAGWLAFVKPNAWLAGWLYCWLVGWQAACCERDGGVEEAVMILCVGSVSKGGSGLGELGWGGLRRATGRASGPQSLQAPTTNAG